VALWVDGLVDLGGVGAARAGRDGRTGGGISGSSSSSESVISVNSPSSSNQEVWVAGGMSRKKERQKGNASNECHLLLYPRMLHRNKVELVTSVTKVSSEI